MWCGLVQLTGRSQPGNRQPLSRALSARLAGPETTRVARPTSITWESASSTRDTVQSQAKRSSVRLETGSENSTSTAGAPSSPFRASTVGVRLTWGFTLPRAGSRAAAGAGQPAVVEGVVGELDQGVAHALGVAAHILGREAPGQRVQRRLDRRPA